MEQGRAWVSLTRLTAPAYPLCLSPGKEDVAARQSQVVWCPVGSEELSKCDQWSTVSNGLVTCASAPTTEDCISQILVRGPSHMGGRGSTQWVSACCEVGCPRGYCRMR